MKISLINSSIQPAQKNKNYKYSDKNSSKANVLENTKKTSFKGIGMGALGASAGLMQWIENRGYFISFLIQDGLGMTLPRVWTGFKRDKEITGKYNKQEGLEVLGREGLTGPYIIGVAPIILSLTGLFRKSTNTNTRLIKRLGQNLKTIVSNPEFNNSIKSDANKFKEEFYKYNLTKIYKDTVPNDEKSEETVNFILTEFKKYDAARTKQARENIGSVITEKINSKILENSDNFLAVNKVKVGDGNTSAEFSTNEVLLAIRDYGKDAIENNQYRTMIDAEKAENIKNNLATSRLLVNIANIVVTLTGLSYLPKLYARSNVAPGAATIAKLQEANLQNKDNDEKKNVTFKGKGPNSKGISSKFGNFITKNISEKAQALLEYNGYNFSRTTFALLATLGLLLPRGKRAWDRAEIDENGKRDMTEINEILLRDTVSSLSVVFAVPLLTKMFVKMYENKIGFVLTNRASDNKSFLGKIGAIMNPYSDLEVLSIADLNAIYEGIDSKAKLMNFAKFVDSKGGDLQKILNKSIYKNEMFNENTFTLDSIKHLSKKEKNEKIINLFENYKVSDIKATDEIISKVMKGTGEVHNNQIAKFARGLNSVPGSISTVIISPILLGLLIPKLTYFNTRKANAKKLAETQKAS